MFAVGTYFTVSLMFWYMGLMPDLATLRDRATTRFKSIADGIFALDGGEWEVTNNIWLVGDDSEVLVFDDLPDIRRALGARSRSRSRSTPTRRRAPSTT